MASKTYLFSITNEEKTNTETVSEMDYKTLDGSCWRAEYHDGKFIHSPGGDKKRSHEDIYLAFLEPGGAKWHMTIEDGKFALREKRDGNVIKRTDECHYYDWEGKERTAKIVVPENGLSDMGKQMQDAMGDVLKNLRMKE